MQGRLTKASKKCKVILLHHLLSLMTKILMLFLSVDCILQYPGDLTGTLRQRRLPSEYHSHEAPVRRNLVWLWNQVRNNVIPGLVDLFLDTRLEVHETEVLEFYVNVNVLEGNVATSLVN
ncbi:hypothetical protein KY285_010250 [Solanum tuberosum]|nr:hypothetical protein KY289_010788 [Solanum tuberosum]KAH0734543.1 hypothetical protein KY285_010250 [Solanum tuberosum]